MRRSIDWLLSLDQRISACLEHWIREYRAIRWIGIILAHSGDGLLVTVTGAIIYACGDNWVRAALGRMFITIVVSAIVVAMLKYAIHRGRPQGENSLKWSAMPRYDRYSFPSGHAARVTGAAWIVGSAFPALCWIGVLWVIGVSLARVAVGAHHLSDVIGGCVCGLVIAYMVNMVVPMV